MPMRSRQAPTRARRPRRRRQARRVPRPVKRKPLALMPHNFVERSGSSLLNINTEDAAVGLFKSFELQDIQQFSAYTTIFEYYKINKVVVNFRYKSIGGQGRT